MQESYRRVIPRDFFNEAKLLKCMGQLSLKIHDNLLPNRIKIKIEEGNGQPFDILLDKENQLLTVWNYPITVNGVVVFMGTNQNSLSPYPFIALYNDEKGNPSIISVFDDKGEFDEEFIEFARSL